MVYIKITGGYLSSVHGEVEVTMVNVNNKPAECSRQVVVVLGVGRSGTSLVMQALKSLGVRTSDKVIPPNESNPEGFFEDSDILSIHRTMLRSLANAPYMPLRSKWLDTEIARKSIRNLKDIVRLNMDGFELPWAFKDPRTATFLPLWTRIFNQLDIVPKYILSVRNPAAVVKSFEHNYGTKREVSEIIFLMRTLDALHYTGGNCLLLRYEEWEKGSHLALQKIVDFVFGSKFEAKASAPFLSSLNRSEEGGARVNNPMIRELYSHLLQGDHPSDRLMKCVAEQREVVQAFNPWCDALQGHVNKIESYENQLSECKLSSSMLATEKKRNERLNLALDEFRKASRSIELCLGDGKD